MAKAPKPRKKPKMSEQITKPKTRHSKEKTAAAFFVAAKEMRIKQGKGHTKAERAASTRAKTARRRLKEKARGKPTKPVVVDDVAAVEPAADMAAGFSDDDDDDKPGTCP